MHYLITVSPSAIFSALMYCRWLICSILVSGTYSQLFTSVYRLQYFLFIKSILTFVLNIVIILSVYSSNLDPHSLHTCSFMLPLLRKQLSKQFTLNRAWVRYRGSYSMTWYPFSLASYKYNPDFYNTMSLLYYYIIFLNISTTFFCLYHST